MTDDRPTDEIPSALIGKQAPELALKPLDTVPTPLLSSQVYNEDQIVVLNVWASHCAPCRVEHPQIQALSQMEGVIVAGINHKDDPEKAKRFLETLGNPFDYIGADPDGSVSLYYGVYGLPETFIIDKSGVIQKKYVGAITQNMLRVDVIPIIERLKSAP